MPLVHLDQIQIEQRVDISSKQETIAALWPVDPECGLLCAAAIDDTSASIGLQQRLR
jgi:hypothetical protein